MGDLFELLVALGIILIGLFGGGRKKKKAKSQGGREAGGQTPPPPLRDHPSPPRAERRAPSAAGGQGGVDDLARELDRLLRGQQAPTTSLPAPTDQPDPEEAVSLEQLDHDMDARHAAFHERYISPLPPPPTGGPAFGTRRAVNVEGIPLRQAIIWREILGPPKALE